MKILTLNYEFPPVGGGGGVAHRLLAEELARRHDVSVITSAYGDLPKREEREGVDIVRVPVLGRNDRNVASLRSLLSFPPAALLAGRKLLRERPYDLVHAHFAVPTGTASLPLAHAVDIPHVLTLHGGDLYDPSKRLSPHRVPGVRRAVRTVVQGSDAVVAQSEDTRRNAQTHFGIDRDIEIIPLGIRVPDHPLVRRSELGLPEDVFLAVTVGRLIPRKGLRRLLRVLARPDCAGMHLVAVGAGPDLQQLEQQARELGLAERVHFTGWVEETRKWQILRCADVYASASMHEGFGLVYLEALATGLPIIAPDQGGQTDFLVDGRTGSVIPADDDDALAAALVAARADPEWSRGVREHNLELSTRYRADACADAYERLYERVLTEHATRNNTTRHEH